MHINEDRIVRFKVIFLCTKESLMAEAAIKSPIRTDVPSVLNCCDIGAPCSSAG